VRRTIILIQTGISFNHRRIDQAKQLVEGKNTMKKLLAITLIVAGTFATAGLASASDEITLGSYSGWAHDAMSNGVR
jgi:hypothetical protein